MVDDNGINWREKAIDSTGKLAHLLERIESETENELFEEGEK
ncbi:hypothetical protein [Bacillus licheniformis]|nr:hypothetical protein [Bacillus licheniformis]KYC82587.1 hypothetical protein B4091_1431 [Bacillus licheniformis]